MGNKELSLLFSHLEDLLIRLDKPKKDREELQKELDKYKSYDKTDKKYNVTKSKVFEKKVKKIEEQIHQSKIDEEKNLPIIISDMEDTLKQIKSTYSKECLSQYQYRDKNYDYYKNIFLELKGNQILKEKSLNMNCGFLFFSFLFTTLILFVIDLANTNYIIKIILFVLDSIFAYNLSYGLFGSYSIKKHGVIYYIFINCIIAIILSLVFAFCLGLLHESFRTGYENNIMYGTSITFPAHIIFGTPGSIIADQKAREIVESELQEWL